jgi:hypothetical protein
MSFLEPSSQRSYELGVSIWGSYRDSTGSTIERLTSRADSAPSGSWPSAILEGFLDGAAEEVTGGTRSLLKGLLH